ncbi:MAG: hypothetical protein PVJ86_08670, partial [Phycisphaerales bacterium]
VWKDRFRKELVRDNSLTDGVCLKVPGKLMVFYKEDTDSIQMNISELQKAVEGIAVDTCRSYKEIGLDGLKAKPGQIFKAPRRSDWAVTVQTILDTE